MRHRTLSSPWPPSIRLSPLSCLSHSLPPSLSLSLSLSLRIWGAQGRGARYHGVCALAKFFKLVCWVVHVGALQENRFGIVDQIKTSTRRVVTRGLLDVSPLRCLCHSTCLVIFTCAVVYLFERGKSVEH